MILKVKDMNISNKHIVELRNAKYTLENPTLAIKIADYIGRPIETLINKLPEKIKNEIPAISSKVINERVKIYLKIL